MDSTEVEVFWRLSANTKAIYTEIVANPSGVTLTLKASASCRRQRHPLIVDATLTPPHLIRPLEYGADI